MSCVWYIVRGTNAQLCYQVNILLDALDETLSLKVAVEFYVGFITLIER